MVQVLSATEVAERLGTVPNWSVDGQTIVRTYQFTSFPEAVQFVTRVAEAAEEANHHPDIDIRYTNVKLSLSTHSAGGITAKDFALAARADELSQQE